MPRILPALIVLVALAHPAAAVDGVIEINQARALAGGITPGDTPGFPVTLNEGGSYRLTGNLTVADPSVDGIVATVEGVTLDLNGFMLSGPGSGTGDGISATDRLTILNGSIRQFGGAGVSASFQCRVEGARLSENGSTGVLLGTGGVLDRVQAHGNGGRGIETGKSSVVSHSTIASNSGGGVLALEGSLISDNAVSENLGDGIEGRGNATIRANAVRGNQNYQILLSAGSGTGGGLIIGNSVFSQSPTHAALRMLSSQHGYRDNVVLGITAGAAFGGTDMGCNLLNGAGACP